MKKNLISVLILALCFANLVLTALLIFTIIPETKKANKSVKRGSLRREALKYKHIYIILIPAILYYVLFQYAPMGGLAIAFLKFSQTQGILGSRWVGLSNFTSFINDVYFWRLLRNTLMINFWG